MKLGIAPDFLSADEQHVWTELALLLDASLVSADAFIVEAFCRHLVRWRRVCDQEREAAEAGEDNYKASMILAGAWKNLESSISKLALTPSDRKRLVGVASKPRGKSKIRQRWGKE
ncbi:MAG: P27 family phage terminase small subunit [Pirellulaceae bacterium]|nr:P27 family phage terminase small subunit [Pirellulaceae bacterium]